MTFPIRCEHLSKEFQRVSAVDDLNLAVPEGSIYALVGPNGAGKTTLIKMLMNIVQPSSGRASVLGVESRHLSPCEMAAIGYVSENQDLPEWMTVSYFLSYLKSFYPAWDDALAQELVRQFDLPRERKLRHLSRGMRMKAALASALAYRPRLIILDEPFSGLDPLVRDEFSKGLLERAAGATVLISSHDLAEIESFASHVGYVDKGRMLFSEEMSALAERLREVEITLSATAETLAVRPETWLDVEMSPAVARFVESQFERERTVAQIQRVFPEARDVSFRPMAFRDIFIALARVQREAA